MLRKRLTLIWHKLRDIYLITTLFLRKLSRTYVLITLLCSYVKATYLTQQTFTCSKSTVETPEKPDICSKLTIGIWESHHWGRSGVFIINFKLFYTFPSFPIVDFEQANICWGNYVAFYSLDIGFNASTGGM